MRWQLKKTIDVNTDEWHQARAKNINSTEVSVLFGWNPWLTEFELWHRKKAGTIVHQETNKAMRWGTREEPIIAKGLEEEYPEILEGKIKPFPKYIYDDEKRIGSSYDWIYEDKNPIDSNFKSKKNH